MKPLFLILFIASTLTVKSQNEAVFFSALKNNDIGTMENYLDDTIDFCIFEDQQIMGKKAALAKLKNFLGNHKVLNVEVLHKGASKDRSSKYKVAKIVTSTDIFRVFIFVSGEIDTKSIKEIRIDKF